MQRFGYDVRDRVTSMTWSNSIDWNNFTYKDDNSLATANNTYSNITRGYNNTGELISETQDLSGCPDRIQRGRDPDAG